MDTSLLIVIILAHLLGYLLYIRGVVGSKITPNTTTWSLLVISVALDIPTYFYGVGHDATLKTVLPVVDCIGALSVWIFAFTRGKFERPDRWDLSIALCQIVALAIWKFNHAPMDANLWLQAAGIIAFIPIIRGVYSGQDVERPLPWMLWSMAFGLEAVIVSRHSPEWREYVYPVCCTANHFIVGMLALRKISTRRSL
ncbi:MAG: hypothetical protein WCK91_00760 [bacterium]